ncbi:Hypothetical predicted protein [Pelobates cultripes]|uniref:Uncharacterized protein n=1 Tax=Pelobates cultripes TaxID=61616 RepID=A0AAD1RQX7_PELCU|nr:Hypothetical predicted protein [Pelobates cultripes]
MGASSHIGNSQSTWMWYGVMDAIYGHRLANQGREGDLDSASALLESIMELVDTVEGLSNDASTFSDDAPSTSSSSDSTMVSTPTQPQIKPNAPRHQHTGDKRRYAAGCAHSHGGDAGSR